MFGAYSLLHVAVPGVNEPHYLGKARAAWDPEWCRHDFFLQSPAAHAVFFNVVGYFTQYWSLAIIAVAGRLLSSLALAWGWSLLAASLGLRRFATVLAAVVFSGLTLTGNFSGEWILGGFESKVPAWAFAFAAVATWLGSEVLSSAPEAERRSGARRRPVITGLYLGISVALHPVVGGWFVVGISMVDLGCAVPAVRRRLLGGESDATAKYDLTSWLTMIGVAVVAGLPGLIPALQVVATSDLSPWEQGMANRIQVFMRLRHHLDPARFPPYAWIHAVTLLVVIGCCSRALLRQDDTQTLRRYLLLIGAAILIGAVGVAVGAHWGEVVHLYHWSPRAFLLKFYPFRLIDVLMPVTASILLVRLLLPVFDRRFGDRSAVRPAFMVTMLTVVLLFAWFSRRESPSGYSTHEYAEWKTACEWICENTPGDSLFVTPREAVAFKWFAERAEYVCYKDCPQDGAGILEWRQRIRNLGELRPIQLNRNLKESDLQKMSSEWQITHFMTRDHVVEDVRPLYRNDVWRVYAATADK